MPDPRLPSGPPSAPRPLARRELLAVGATGAGLIALAACSSSSNAGGTSASSPPPAKPGETLLKLAEIKVGDSAAAELPSGDPILISRTADGTVVAFSAICTHKGCTVNPAGKELHCPCHGSKFDAATGKVIGGPAPSPLAKVDVHVADGAVVTGRA